MSAKPLCIRFDKIDGFIKIYLVLFDYECLIKFVIGLNIL